MAVPDCDHSAYSSRGAVLTCNWQAKRLHQCFDLGRTTGPLRSVIDGPHVSASYQIEEPGTEQRLAAAALDVHPDNERTIHDFGHSEILQRSKGLRLHTAG